MSRRAAPGEYSWDAPGTAGVRASDGMIFTSATEYAMRGLSEVAARGLTGRFMLDDLVAGTGLPRDFTAKIFQRLAKAGVIASSRGRGGGFQLPRPAHAITLLEVVTALEGDDALRRCVVGLPRCDEQAACPLHDAYKPIRQRLRDFLGTTTLADLGASLRTKAEWEALRAAGVAAATAARDGAEGKETLPKP